MYDLIIYLLAVVSVLFIIRGFLKAIAAYSSYKDIKDMGCFKDIVVSSAYYDFKTRLGRAVMNTIVLTIVWMIGAWLL